MEKNRVLAFQKVAKTGNIGKKSPVAGGINYVRYLSMQKVKDALKSRHLRSLNDLTSGLCSDFYTVQSVI